MIPRAGYIALTIRIRPRVVRGKKEENVDMTTLLKLSIMCAPREFKL